MVALQAEHHLNRRSSFTGNSIMQYYSSQNCKKSENWQLIKLQTIRISWKCKITFLNGISMFSKLCLYVYLEIIQKLDQGALGMSDPSPVSHRRGDQAIRNTRFIRGHQKQRCNCSKTPAVHHLQCITYGA